jgi:hypothetical protein
MPLCQTIRGAGDKQVTGQHSLESVQEDASEDAIQLHFSAQILSADREGPCEIQHYSRGLGRWVGK